MKSGNLFWGIVLVSIGGLFILRNMNLLYFNWFAIAQLWPVIIIILGISLLPIKTAVRVFLSFLVVISSIVFVTSPKFRSYHSSSPFWHWKGDDFNFHWRDKDKSAKDSADEKWDDQLLFENYDKDIQFAVLDMDAVAGVFTLKQNADYLFRFNRSGEIGRYYLRADNATNAVVLKLRMDTEIKSASNIRNEAEIGLHPEPVWTFKIDAGASKIDFDLEPFKVDRFDIKGGATSLNLKLGDKSEKTDLRIDSGASSVVILIPENSGCQVRTNTFLTGKSLDGFIQNENNNYQTENFESATNKIFIRVDAALSSLKVERY